MSNPVQIVGLGASAGGIEALAEFLQNVSPTSDLAYVIIQHRSLDSTSVFLEILQRATTLPILDITDGLEPAANHIYVAPPQRCVSILNGILHFEPIVPGETCYLPIDYFFQSLANDQGSEAIGVILSGMGFDGTQGIKVIKERGGLCFAQKPLTAGFDSMPSSAIESGAVDEIALPKDMPGRIFELVSHFQQVPHLPNPWTHDENNTLYQILNMLHIHSGQDFSQYKKGTLYRRIERRLVLLQLKSVEEYRLHLIQNAAELKQLLKELLIGVTNFFRDPQVWVQLKNEIIPSILANHPDGGTIRAWVAGCSTGEEAYSLAMIFREVLEQDPAHRKYALQIFATDLDPAAIEKARNAIYPESAVAEIPRDRLSRFFTEDSFGYRLNKSVRELVIFAQHNLIKDPPFTQLDILSCRNLLIYFDNELQRKLMPLLFYGLRARGFLLLGSAETIGTATELFTARKGPGRFYQKKTGRQPLSIEFPNTFTPAGELNMNHSDKDKDKAIPDSATLEKITGLLLLRDYSPAAMLVTDQGQVLYISGRTGKYLEPAIGRANWNLFALAREGLNLALNESFNRAIREKKTVTITDIRIGLDLDTSLADVTVRPLSEPEGLNGLLLIVFTDRGKLPPLGPNESLNGGDIKAFDPKVEELLGKLKRAQDALDATRQEMQTSQEELKSSNEELQSSNEELQSTNEELTTSREEIQSMNEELQTINHELQAKIDELSHTSSDMKNLLNSTDVATLFLDESLNIRRYTAQATAVFKLIPSDAGRPITDLVTALDYPQLVSDASEVLRTLVFTEKQIPSVDGRWFTVRIMPYRTMDNRIDGVVITFFNITAAKQLEADLRNRQFAVLHAFDSALTGMAIVPSELKWIQVNRSLCQLLGYDEFELLASISSEIIHPDSLADYQASLCPSGATITAKLIHKAGHAFPVQLSISAVGRGDEKPTQWLLQVQCQTLSR